MNDTATPIPRRTILKLFPTYADAFKIVASYLIGFAAISYCLYVAATKGENFHLQLLICILGGAIGWIAGLLLTPDSEGEKRRFSEAGKMLAALAAGFGVGKADDISLWIKPYLISGSNEHITVRALLFFCSLLIAGLFTYISRLHVRDELELLRKRREELLLEASETLEKISRLN